jgi:hypothetical protein
VLARVSGEMSSVAPPLTNVLTAEQRLCVLDARIALHWNGRGPPILWTRLRLGKLDACKIQGDI